MCREGSGVWGKGVGYVFDEVLSDVTWRYEKFIGEWEKEDKLLSGFWYFFSKRANKFFYLRFSMNEPKQEIVLVISLISIHN